MRRARWKRKNVSAGRSAQAQPSCRRRGMVGSPVRQSGVETPGPWGALRPGDVRGYLLLCFPLPLTLPRRARQRLAKRKVRKAEQIKSVYHPGQPPYHPPRVGSYDFAEGPSVPEGHPKSALAPIRRPPCARRATAPERVKAAFSFGPGAAHFLLNRIEKKMGGASTLMSGSPR